MPDANGIHTQDEIAAMGYGGKQKAIAAGLSRLSTQVEQSRAKVTDLYAKLVSVAPVTSEASIATAEPVAPGTVDPTTIGLTREGADILLTFADGSAFVVTKRPDGDIDFAVRPAGQTGLA